MTKSSSYTSLLACCMAVCGSAFVVVPVTNRVSRPTFRLMGAEDQIVSPFDSSGDGSELPTAGGGVATASEFLDLTWENVERVLDEMRPFLIQDGGNVVISDIDGPVVKLELQGACGTCPSSTQTMKMG
jgi:NifU-like domain